MMAKIGASCAGLLAAAIVGGWPGAVAGLAVAILLWRVLPRLPSRAERVTHQRAVNDLPLAADLVAAALRAGATPERAARETGAAIGGPVGERLERAGHSIRLGEPAATAWECLSDLPGADRFVRAAAHSTESGAALAGALTRLADDLRSAQIARAEAAARRAGVLIVLPLGLCFLPAFLLAGVVPVVIAVLDGVLG
jgi:Flp pilus assembly protein TadB